MYSRCTHAMCLYAIAYSIRWLLAISISVSFSTSTTKQSLQKKRTKKMFLLLKYLSQKRASTSINAVRRTKRITNNNFFFCHNLDSSESNHFFYCASFINCNVDAAVSNLFFSYFSWFYSIFFFFCCCYSIFVVYLFCWIKLQYI